jgi:IS1 family transposase/transposase-like protein
VQCYCCQGKTKKAGKFTNRNGIVQRYSCLKCGKTSSETQPFDGLRTERKTIVQIVKLIAEGCSVRATSRLTGCHVRTVLSVLETIGDKCADLLDKRVRNIKPDSLQLDELWSRVGCTQKNSKGDKERGDFYTFLAIEARTKLIVSHYTGKRDGDSTNCFVEDLASRIDGTVQITCDGWAAYPDAIRAHLLGRLHLAVMQKIFRSDNIVADSARRYSAGEFIGVKVETCAGAPHIDKIGTSYVERVNLTVRTFNRRFTRLSLGFSRKVENHRHAVALFVAAYNFCKVHTTLGTTPAVGAGIAAEPWTVERLVNEATGTN